MKVKKNEDRIVARIDPGIKDRFEARCLERGLSMSDRLRELIEKDIVRK